MNCKPGDLAVIVKALTESQHVGKIVRVVELRQVYNGIGWSTEPTLYCSDGFVCLWADEHLRPIRDSDGEDEMLRIVGKPQEVTA